MMYCLLKCILGLQNVRLEDLLVLLLYFDFVLIKDVVHVGDELNLALYLRQLLLNLLQRIRLLDEVIDVRSTLLEGVSGLLQPFLELLISRPEHRLNELVKLLQQLCRKRF